MRTADPERHSAFDAAVLPPPSPLTPSLPCFLACRLMSTTLSLLSLSACIAMLVGVKIARLVEWGGGVRQRSGLELTPRKSSHCSGGGHRANAHVKWRGIEAQQPKGSEVD